MQRLDKFLCDCGAGTRSQIKEMIKAGRVSVDGRTEKDGGKKIDPEKQQVLLDGMPMESTGQLVLMLNKPAGFVTATTDAKERTVMELLPPELKNKDLKPVGRLDKQTEGLLLFTNDGALLHRLISPKKQIPKVYYARHEGTATNEDVQAFAQGLTLGDGTECLPAELKPLGAGESLITVCEGKYHQVRRMMASRGMPVDYLERKQEGGLILGDLPRGVVRLLTTEEIQSLGK
jgi:16S rRNA pseudouridine516 synthase